MQKILLIDSKAGMWEDELRETLSPEYELVCEEVGSNYLQRLEAEKPDLVLLSQRFPKQSRGPKQPEKEGITILKGLKRDAIGAGLKTIVVLDRPSPKREAEFLVAGANYCFVRGRDLNALKTQIAYALAVPKARILFIDDEWKDMNWDIKLSDNLGTGKLGPGGFEVICVEDDKKGYQKLNEERMDLVLLDLKFKGRGETYGIEILKEIKRRKPGLEVIMLSGQELNPAVVVKCTQAGSFDYRAKYDIDWNQFADLINRALAKSEHAREFHARIDRLRQAQGWILPRRFSQQDVDEFRRAVNAMASEDHSQPILYFKAAMEIFLRNQYDNDNAASKELSGLIKLVKQDYESRFISFPARTMVPIEPNLTYLGKLNELRNFAAHTPCPGFTRDDAIIAARLTLRSAEGLMNEHNPARIDHDWEELSKKVESLPAGDLKYQLQFALFSFERDDRTQCYNAIHQAMLDMLEALYPQIIANPLLPTSASQVKRAVGEINDAILPYSTEENSRYLHPNWQEFADVQHLMTCYLDWTGELNPHLPHLQPEDLLIGLRVAIRVMEWFLGDYQNSDRFRKVREGGKSRYHVRNRF